MNKPLITTPMTAEFFSNSPFNLLHVDIVQDADWNDGFQILESLPDVPMDLTGKLLELYIRPKYAHATLFKKLSSASAGGIIVDDAVNGLAYFFMDRADVLATFPVGTWNQFFVLTEGALQTEIWRGEMRVHPGLISVTP